MPDIEKRLEAFVRIAHGIIIFPGGVGAGRRVAVFAGNFNEPGQQDQVLPLILTGPKRAPTTSAYWTSLSCIRWVKNARRHYRIIIDDAAEVARQMKKSMPLVRKSP